MPGPGPPHTGAPRPAPPGLTMWQETPPGSAQGSLFGKGLSTHPSASIYLPAIRGGLQGTGSPRSPRSHSPLAAACPLRPARLVTTRAGQPGRPPFHSSPSLPCLHLAPPPPGRRIAAPLASAPRTLPHYWLHWLSIKTALRYLRTELEQRKNPTQGGGAKRVNREERTIRRGRRGEPRAGLG